MVDVALQGGALMSAQQVDRAKVLQKLRIERRDISRSDPCAPRSSVLFILGGIIVSLIYGSLPALRAFGFGFLFTEIWNPVTEKFGAIAPIYGTIVTSFIAMLIAVPVGLFIAMFLTELCPMWLRRPIGIAIELLAGIPSIIYGIWGLFVFAPFLQQYVQPLLIDTLGQCPRHRQSVRRPALRHRHPDRRPDPRHHGAALHHLDLARRVRGGAAGAQGGGLWPRLHHLGSRALRGAAFTRVGVIGGVMLGLGRALGETMAVTFVIGNAHRIAGSILAPGTTISATIANEFTEAVGDLYTSSLIALGLILFVITFIVLAIARAHADAPQRAGRSLTMTRSLLHSALCTPPPPQRRQHGACLSPRRRSA